MIRISKAETYGWEAAIRGMRNPMNSWDKSDSYPAVDCGNVELLIVKVFVIRKNTIVQNLLAMQ